MFTTPRCRREIRDRDRTTRPCTSNPVQSLPVIRSARHAVRILFIQLALHECAWIITSMLLGEAERSHSIELAFARAFSQHGLSEHEQHGDITLTAATPLFWYEAS